MQVVASRVILPGGAAYFVFIWLVVPVIVTFTCAETAVLCLFLVLAGLFYLWKYLLLFLVPGGCRTSLLRRVLKWWHL